MQDPLAATVNVRSCIGRLVTKQWPIWWAMTCRTWSKVSNPLATLASWSEILLVVASREASADNSSSSLLALGWPQHHFEHCSISQLKDSYSASFEQIDSSQLIYQINARQDTLFVHCLWSLTIHRLHWPKYKLTGKRSGFVCFLPCRIALFCT